MSNEPNRLPEAERARIVSTLTEYSKRLDETGELLAALQIRHALECLDPENPLNRMPTRQGD